MSNSVETGYAHCSRGVGPVAFEEAFSLSTGLRSGRGVAEYLLFDPKHLRGFKLQGLDLYLTRPAISS